MKLRKTKSNFKMKNHERTFSSFRWTDIAVLITALLIAYTAGFIIDCLNSTTEYYSNEKTQVADLAQQIFLLNTRVDDAILGADLDDDTNSITKQIDVSFDRLKNKDPHRDIILLEKAYRNYYRYAMKQLDLVKNDQKDGAIYLDKALTDPAFHNLQILQKKIDHRLEMEANQWRIRSKVTMFTWLMLGALVTAWLSLYHQGRIVHSVTSIIKQSMFQANERRLKSIIRSSRDILILVDETMSIKMINDAVQRLCGHQMQTLIGTSVLKLIDLEDEARLFNYIQESLAVPGGDIRTEVKLLCKEQSSRPFEVQLTNLLQDPDVNGLLLTLHDLSEHKEFEARLGKEAFYDSLTGLPNRALLMDRLGERLHTAEKQPSTVAVMFLDLDNFKIVNDSLGHETGDKLLLAVTERLRSVLRSMDTLARLGGDEFVVLLGEVHTVEMATMMASRIVSAFEHPVLIAGREIFVTTSIGIALNSELTTEAEGLLRDADIAMYQAKNNGKASYIVFDRSMNEQAVERLELEVELRKGILMDQLELFFQPIVSISSTEIQEVEALIRWRHPERGLIPPLKFIPIAEETGLICSIGLWVLREGCSKLQMWHRQFPSFSDLGMSINVSGRQLQQDDFVEQVAEILKEYAIAPKHIKLEVTESVMLNNLDRTREILKQLRQMGVRVAIDDFGTGYSSMSYLQRLPVDTLKIDRSFINALSSNEQGAGIVRAIIAMARTLGLEVTSEGIETPEQMNVLNQLGCEYGQGFLFSKPLSATGMVSLLASNAKDKTKQQAA